MAPITLLIVILYGAIVAYLGASLIHAADRWLELAPRPSRPKHHSEPEAVPAERQEPEPERAAPAPSPASMAQTRFAEAYFALRLGEEVHRCRREGVEMSVVALDMQQPSNESTRDRLDEVGLEMARLASDHAALIALPLQVGATEYVFCLPHSDREATDDFVSKLVRALGDYWCHYGVALYPDDASSEEALVDYARRECDESREGREKRPAKSRRLLLR